MLATTTIFYSQDWPKRLFAWLKISKPIYDQNGKFGIANLSSHCIYEKSDFKQEDLTSKIVK